MAVIASRHPTLVDLKNATGVNMQVQAVVELLALYNPILEHASMVEGNLENGMQYGVRRYLPKGQWRKLYQGVKPTKSGRVQVVENAANLVAYSEIDADMPGDKAGLRADEDRAHVEGMAQQIATSLFYGDNRADPAQFNGLGMRYAKVSGAANSQNVLDAGGTGNDNRSIWFIGWDTNKVTMFYPKPSTGTPVPTNTALGISVEDLGRVTTNVIDEKADQGLMEVERTRFSSKLGLCVKDWRFGFRICNIDISDLSRNPINMDTGQTRAGGGAFLDDLIRRAIWRFGGASTMKGGIRGYAPRDVLSFLDRQRVTQGIHGGRTENGQAVMGADSMLTIGALNIPIHATDALLVDEARVT